MKTSWYNRVAWDKRVKSWGQMEVGRNKNQTETEEIYAMGGIWSKEVERTGKNRIVKITGEYVWS